MEKRIDLKGSYITACGENLEIFTGKSTIGLSFNCDFGFVINRYCNHSGDRNVEYITEEQPFCPIKPEENQQEAAEVGEFDKFVNAAKDETTTTEYTLSDDKWHFVSSNAEKITYGGMEALKLTANISKSDCNITLHLVVFPGCSVIRNWFDVENTANHNTKYNIAPCALNIAVDNPADTYRGYWFHGANATYEYGMRYDRGFRHGTTPLDIKSNMCASWVPLIIFERENSPNDGIMIEMDYLSHWNLHAEKLKSHLAFNFDIEKDNGVTLESGQTITTPTVTIATYSGDMDSLMVELYDWQYAYMWDYALNDYYAKFRDNSTQYPWVYCSRVLHEQFAYRIVCMDLLGNELRSRVGTDMCWDDAGWSSFPGWPDRSYMTVFNNTYEGPDHRLSLRYMTKADMKMLIWFAGKPSQGVLGSKEGGWGEFEWRTDGLHIDGFHDQSKFMNLVKRYLDGNIRRSFHTCSGGGTYALNFDIQRYANFHYASDSRTGPCKNYYYSYFTVPDRWGDTLPHHGGERTANDGSQCWDIQGPRLSYNPDHARANLSMSGLTGPNTEKTYQSIREDIEIYKYLIEKGVAGRWSYMFHPGVYGDKEIYYPQRTSRDRLRACIIIRRRPEGRVVLYPKELIENELYKVSFEISDESFTKTGKEIMEEGFVIKNVAPRELIYFNLDDSPSKRKDAVIPVIENAVCRKESNVGMTGVGVYWCCDTKNVRYYEIARNGEVIGSVAKAKYYFDYNTDLKCNPEYSVRAVGFGDKVGEWTNAVMLSDAMPIFSTLGSHGEDMAKTNWYAETSCDLKEFTPMNWVTARYSGADLGGTPNQPGGIEGYFEGGQCARIGRGWQQASPDAYCVRTFVVPFDGNVTLTGRAMKEWYHSEYGCDVDVCVMKNEEIIVPFTTLKRNDVNGLSYNINLDVIAGDTLRFVVGKCDADKNNVVHFEKDANIIGWNTIITYNGKMGETSDFVCRINCGGEEFTDQNSVVWGKDNYFKYGDTKTTQLADKLYSSARVGERISYSIPVPNGVYAVRLCFAETEFKYSNERFMKININGKEVESEFDIAHDARGANKIYTKVYRYTIPNNNGLININLSSLKNDACISGIEIVNENDDIIHINCGSEDFVDWAGFLWDADRYYTGGETVTEKEVMLKQANPTLYDKALYFKGRKGADFSYNIPVKEGIYSVQLKFAELELQEANQRPIDIYINNKKVKEDWDALASAEDYPMTADVRFDDTSSCNGYINIRIVSKGKNPAILRAIEIDS